MELTQNQKLALAERIASEFSSFAYDEYNFQVEAMKDTDDLGWEYQTNNKDAEDIKQLVIDMIAVPVR